MKQHKEELDGSDRPDGSGYTMHVTTRKKKSATLSFVELPPTPGSSHLSPSSLSLSLSLPHSPPWPPPPPPPFASPPPTHAAARRTCFPRHRRSVVEILARSVAFGGATAWGATRRRCGDRSELAGLLGTQPRRSRHDTLISTGSRAPNL
ncbi:hypothetical protein BDA96_02G169100 [Sorghum bicolor]|uniref:Uncharacterized protein n=2 Tax=Sorghum bicolor TaxID=4558 RepID=A0A921UT39_SORBI|nr:hypothetical protein BDA96_02G169100 [Sorghum bicolor]KXG35348.1 hypothetical protein SORBI_3002G162500 [Sorghum bicolor]